MNADIKDLQINRDNLGCKKSLTITISVTQRVATVAETLSFSNSSSHHMVFTFNVENFVFC